MNFKLQATIQPVKNLSGELKHAVRVDEEACDKAMQEGYNVGVSVGHYNGLKEGYEQGKQEIFGYMGQLSTIFHSTVFPDGYELYMSVPSRSGVVISQMIYGATGLRKLTITDSPLAEIKSYFAFGSCRSIEELDLSNFVQGGGAVVLTDASYLAYGNLKLRAIYGELDFSVCVNLAAPFANCTALEEIRIKAGTLRASISFAQSNVLSDASIQSIIDGLADLTGQTAQEITFHPTVKEKLTPEQKATITAKNWILK